MKVLIETATNRKGYKHFDVFDDFKDFLNTNYKKIKQYQILNEDDDETEEMLQSFIEDCDLIEKKLFWLFRQYEPIDEKYSLKLIYASGRVHDAMNAIKKCLR